MGGGREGGFVREGEGAGVSFGGASEAGERMKEGVMASLRYGCD